MVGPKVNSRDFCTVVALARGKREPGQDLGGAAISVVLLCEGRFRTECLLISRPNFSIDAKRFSSEVFSQ